MGGREATQKIHGKMQEECAGFSHLQATGQSHQCLKLMEAGLLPGQKSQVMEVNAFLSIMR